MRIRLKRRYSRAIFHSVLIGALLVVGMALPAWAASDRHAATVITEKRVIIKGIGLLPPPRPASPHR